MELRRGDTAAVCLDVANRLVDVHDGNRALETDHLLPACELAALLQRAAHCHPLLARLDQVEIGRPLRLEAPAEDGLVEFARARDIVCVDREEVDIVGHAPTV